MSTIDINRIRELIGDDLETVNDADLSEALQQLPGHSIEFSVRPDGSLTSELTMGDVELILNALDEAQRRGFKNLRPPMSDGTEIIAPRGRDHHMTNNSTTGEYFERLARHGIPATPINLNDRVGPLDVLAPLGREAAALTEEILRTDDGEGPQ